MVQLFGKSFTDPLNRGVEAIRGGECGGGGNQGRASVQGQVTPLEALNAGVFHCHDVVPILQRIWEAVIPGLAFDGLD